MKEREILHTWPKRFPFPELQLLDALPENIDKWREEIEALLSAYQSKDELQITEAHFGVKELANATIELCKANELNEEDLIMLAIGNWLLFNKAPWKGFKGVIEQKTDPENRTRTLEDLLHPLKSAYCDEINLFFNRMAQEFSLKGGIYKLAEHTLWMNKRERIIDVMFGGKLRRVFFRDKKEFRSYMKNHPDTIPRLSRFLPFQKFK